MLLVLRCPQFSLSPVPTVFPLSGCLFPHVPSVAALQCPRSTLSRCPRFFRAHHSLLPTTPGCPRFSRSPVPHFPVSPVVRLSSTHDFLVPTAPQFPGSPVSLFPGAAPPHCSRFFDALGFTFPPCRGSLFPRCSRFSDFPFPRCRGSQSSRLPGSPMLPFPRCCASPLLPLPRCSRFPVSPLPPRPPCAAGAGTDGGDVGGVELVVGEPAEQVKPHVEHCVQPQGPCHEKGAAGATPEVTEMLQGLRTGWESWDCSAWGREGSKSKVEDIVQEVYDAYKTNHHSSQYVLQREKHFHYLKRGLRQLTEAYECLDASRPWLCYWILHSLELLDEPIPESVASDVCQFLRRCQSPQGGFGGGPGQHPHLAPTYAAVNALCIIGTEEAFGVIDRQKLLEYLHSLKQPDGSFLMHMGGEVDVRSAYCAASVASLTNILTPTLFAGTAEWIARCQNWEGGIGGVPGMEAHGGYTFCGVATLVILKKEHLLNLRSLLHWVTGRQMRFEGGFQGRCNKLVDGCYSFWQAGLLPLLHRALHARGDPALSMAHWMFDQLALQEYILLCCQCPAGGLLDKPGKSRDFYHTCYCLSGLAIAQHFGSGDLHNEVVLGIPENCLQATHPVYNIAPEKVARAVMHFLQYPVPSLDPASPAK